MFTYLESYNEAVTFSSGKGLAHTLARRAGFLLQTSEHMLALRDLHLGNRGNKYFLCLYPIFSGQRWSTGVWRTSCWTGCWSTTTATARPRTSAV